MREEDSNWFPKWEEELPSPEDLMPLSQTLITPDLALAFDIPNPNSPHQHQQHQQLQQQQPPQPNSSAEFESAVGGAASGGGGGGGVGDEPARTLKRPRLVWTPQLHKRFVDAVSHLGIKNAVPKTIMQLMSVDGLTRENVASHLQKYRLYLKRTQGINSNNGNGNGGNSVGNVNVNVVDPATDHLFASSPVPAHFLRSNSDHFMPYVAMQQHHHHPQVVMGQQFRHFGNSTPNGQFEHPFLAVRHQPQVQRMGSNGGNPVMPSSYVEDMESATAAAAAANGKKVLTLFPTGEH